MVGFFKRWRIHLFGTKTQKELLNYQIKEDAIMGLAHRELNKAEEIIEFVLEKSLNEEVIENFPALLALLEGHMLSVVSFLESDERVRDVNRNALSRARLFQKRLHYLMGLDSDAEPGKIWSSMDMIRRDFRQISNILKRGYYDDAYGPHIKNP